MDAGELEELTVLRRRAYGRLPDLETAGLARLQELEDLARVRAAVRPAPVIVAADESVRTRRRRPFARSVGISLVAAVVLAGVIVVQPTPLGVAEPLRASSVGPASLPFVLMAPGATHAPRSPDEPGTVLLGVPLDESLPQQRSTAEVPVFPLYESPLWTTRLGTYFGWALWIARSRDGLLCVLVERDDKAHRRCVPEEKFLDGALQVAVAYDEIPLARVPIGMDPPDSLAFRWVPRKGVVIELVDG